MTPYERDRDDLPETDPAAPVTPDPHVTDVKVVPRDPDGGGDPPPSATVAEVVIGHTPHRGRLWWSFLVSGALCVGFGIAILFVPQYATRLAVVLFGALEIFTGAMLAWSALATRTEPGGIGLGLWPGIVLIAVGIAFVAFSSAVAKFFVVLWAIVALLVGAWDVASAVLNDQPSRWWRLARGVLLVGAGLFFLVRPNLGVVAAGIVIGLVLIAVGMSSLAIVVTTRKTGI